MDKNCIYIVFQNRVGRSTGYKAAIPKLKTGKNLRLFLELENESSQNFKLYTLMKWSNKFSSKGIRCMFGNLYLCCESYEGSEFCVKSRDRFKNSSVSQMGTCGKMIYFLKNISLKMGGKENWITEIDSKRGVENKTFKSTHKLFSILKVGAIIKNNSQPVLSSAFCSDYLLKTLPPEALGFWSKDVSAPVRTPLNTDGATLPIRSTNTKIDKASLIWILRS